MTHKGLRGLESERGHLDSILTGFHDAFNPQSCTIARSAQRVIDVALTLLSP